MTQQKLFELKDKTITQNLIQSNNLASENVDEVIEDESLKKELLKSIELNDKIYNISIASNGALKENIFTILYQIDDFDVNLALVYNIKTPKEILKTLYEKNIHEINTLLAENTNTQINILMQLQVDNRYHTLVSNNETYKEFSRNSLGIISDRESQFKRSTYDMGFFN